MTQFQSDATPSNKAGVTLMNNQVGYVVANVMRDKENVTITELPSMIRVDGVNKIDFDFEEIAEALVWDDFGNDDFNYALALRRAETVRDQLAEAGVAATRMHIAAFGRESRVSPCTAPGCAAQNRRAVLVLTDARGSRLSTSSKQAARDGASPAVAPGRSGAPSRRDR